MVDAKVELIRQPSFWLALLFVLALATILLWVAWRALNGTYRPWVRNDEYPHAPPWRPEEVEAVLAMPAGRKRDGMVQDMEWCGIDVDAAWARSGLPGRPPKEWWEKKVEAINADNAAMGITEDMDVFERAVLIRQHREQVKAARKTAREVRRDG